MLQIRKLASAALVAATVTGCVSDGTGTPNNTASGAIIGGLAGGLIGAATGSGGSDTVARAVVGAAAGAVIGAAIGAILDQQEQEALAFATADAAENAPTGERIVWEVPKEKRKPRPRVRQSSDVAMAAPGDPNGASRSAGAAAPPASGFVTPTSDRFVDAKGRTCRNLHQVAVKDGKTVEEDVTACKTNGGWTVPPKA